MGAFLDKPKTEKHNEAGEGNGLHYGLASMQGWRVEMEDAHSAVTGLGPFNDWSFFGVFDGHAGGKVSDFCASDLLQQILKSEPFKSINSPGENQDEVKLGIYTGFLNMDALLREKNSDSGGEDRSGSTAICVLVSPTQIYFANCGDSRAVLCRNKEAVHYTTDHKPVLPEEKNRIQKAGGSVMIQRVNGSLAVSRALGDFEYKNASKMGPTEQLVSPEPEITIKTRSAEQDEFVVLACDGIWDVMSNQELCDLITSRLMVTDDLKDVCNQVVDTCLHKGSRDNMSIVLVTFANAPKVTPEALQKEKELDKKIADKVQACVDANDADLDFSTVWTEVTKDPIEGLPPGGGFASKRTYTEAVFMKLRRIDPSMNDNGSSN
ncbi:protein phosphatase 1B-like [Lineus longissimus]|uniref:protein phosphatase 1B-like n=1 Tax=Lineus longissimus TaxID=88925 RepID=UPI00315D99E0